MVLQFACLTRAARSPLNINKHGLYCLILADVCFLIYSITSNIDIYLHLILIFADKSAYQKTLKIYIYLQGLCRLTSPVYDECFRELSTQFHFETLPDTTYKA